MAFDSIIVNTPDISELIPQKPPIVMVDALYYNDDEKSITGFTINKENIFCSNGYFREPGIIENIAQSAALRMGYICKLRKVPVPLGFIGALKNLQIYSIPNDSADLKTEIIIDYNILDFQIITGKVYCEDNLIAQCEMKIFTKNN